LRLIVTGGGTGGHIFPALEVAREAKAQNAEIFYFGSLRGQEGAACTARGIPFTGFAVEPLYSLRSLRGWRSLVGLLRARGGARRAMRELGADAVFSTGGYGAVPAMSAAQALRVPFVVHEANSIPGRANRMFGLNANAFTCVFTTTLKRYPNLRPVRTGQPVRRELREAAASREPDALPLVLVLGGSQGSEFLNEAVPEAAARLGDRPVRFLHASGPKHIEALRRRTEALGLGQAYQAVGFLETDQMVDAYRRATLAVARSGGTLAEFAAVGLPSVLVPLPTSADDHQLHNAREFADMDAATLLEQSSATPEALAGAIGAWLDGEGRRERAQKMLAGWDLPHATGRIVEIVRGAAR
jgi:UDP-N-acetylglucosamine--N-acetylmuramyl-(pentapeptide) pyrophosphoryl-undecaprenol N-acetylglucosamine transferase